MDHEIMFPSCLPPLQDVFLIRLAGDDALTSGGSHAWSGGGGGVPAISVAGADYGGSPSSSSKRPLSTSWRRATMAAPLPRPSRGAASPPAIYILAVFDGHGEVGGRLAQYSAYVSRSLSPLRLFLNVLLPMISLLFPPLRCRSSGTTWTAR